MLRFSNLVNRLSLRRMSDFSNIFTENQHSKTPIPGKFQFFPLPLYGGKYTVTLIPGNGIGLELIDHIKAVLKETRAGIEFEEIPSLEKDEDSGKDLHHIKSSIQRNRVALKGCIEKETQGSLRSQNNLIVKSELDIYISIVHGKSYNNIECLNPNIDIVIARQSSEGEYLMLEHETVKGNVEALKVVTRQKTEQFAKWALIYARAHRRRRITIVHKSDVYAISDGLFVDTIREQARDFRDLKLETMRLSPFIEKLLRKPHLIDFVMIPNLYGSAATNILCGLIGGPGLLSKKSYNNFYAIFEPAVGTLGKDLVGKNNVNPVAMLNSLRDMLAYLQLDSDANAIDCAIKKTLKDDIKTPDIGGNHTTSDFIERVKYHIRRFIY